MDYVSLIEKNNFSLQSALFATQSKNAQVSPKKRQIRKNERAIFLVIPH